jgi:pimeloyl-ACP methyl ester carboxylesterase
LWRYATGEKAISSVNAIQCWFDRYKNRIRGLGPDPGYWPKIYDKVGSIQWEGFSKAELASIEAPFLILNGDHDFVRLEHAVETFKLIPNTPKKVIPIVKHFLEEPAKRLPLATAKRAITPGKPGKREVS